MAVKESEITSNDAEFARMKVEYESRLKEAFQQTDSIKKALSDTKDKCSILERGKKTQDEQMARQTDALNEALKKI